MILKPISPDIADKKIVINVSNQTMACFEGKNEVYFCRISTGAKFDAAGNAVDKWSTPVGLYHAITGNISRWHMAVVQPQADMNYLRFHGHPFCYRRSGNSCHVLAFKLW